MAKQTSARSRSTKFPQIGEFASTLVRPIIYPRTAPYQQRQFEQRLSLPVALIAFDIPVTRRYVLQQLDGDNAEATHEMRVRQAYCTSVREQYTAENLEWADNVPPPCEPGIEGDQHTVIKLATQVRVYFVSGSKKSREIVIHGEFFCWYGHIKSSTARLLTEILQYRA